MQYQWISCDFIFAQAWRQKQSYLCTISARNHHRETLHLWHTDIRYTLTQHRIILNMINGLQWTLGVLAWHTVYRTGWNVRSKAFNQRESQLTRCKCGPMVLTCGRRFRWAWIFLLASLFRHRCAKWWLCGLCLPLIIPRGNQSWRCICGRGQFIQITFRTG